MVVDTDGWWTAMQGKQKKIFSDLSCFFALKKIVPEDESYYCMLSVNIPSLATSRIIKMSM